MLSRNERRESALASGIKTAFTRIPPLEIRVPIEGRERERQEEEVRRRACKQRQQLMPRDKKGVKECDARRLLEVREKRIKRPVIARVSGSRGRSSISGEGNQSEERRMKGRRRVRGAREREKREEKRANCCLDMLSVTLLL